MLGTAYELWTLENVEEETKFKFMLYASGATFSKLFPDTRTDEANNTDDIHFLATFFTQNRWRTPHTTMTITTLLCYQQHTTLQFFTYHFSLTCTPNFWTVSFQQLHNLFHLYNNPVCLQQLEIPIQVFPRYASPSVAGFILHFISSMVSSKVFRPKTGRIGDDSLHVSRSVCTSAGPVGSPSVWACAPTASGALSISRWMSRAVNVALSSWGQNTVKITET